MSDQDLFTGTQPIAPGRGFDVDKLQAYMEENVAGFTGALDVREFKGGQSNPTYSLTAGGKRYVMRRKPPGQLLKSAHAVDREYKVMSALNGTGVPVPRTYALCTDEGVIGTWFYIMDHVDGRIIWGNDVPGSDPEERAAIHDSMIETFARLHAVDYRAVGLSDYGRPTDYMARTLNRFIGQYRLEETTKIPEMDWLADWLPENIPPEEPAAIVHGDYKLANLVLHPTEPKVIAILDWELSTIGQPLADLAVYALYYRQGSDTPGGLKDLPLKDMGIPTEEEMLALYRKYSGRDSIPHWEYYLAAMLFRHAQISLGILARAQKGTASSEHALMMGKRAWPQSKAAYDIARTLAR